MNAPLMFSFKRSLVTRLFAIVMVVTFVAPNILAVAIPVAYAEDEVAAESSDASDVSSNETEAADTASDSQDESNSTSVEAVAVSNETVADSTDTTVVSTTKVSDSVSPVSSVADTDVLTDTKDITTDTDTTTDVPAGDDTTGGTTPTDTTPADNNDDGTAPEPREAAALNAARGSISVCKVLEDDQSRIVQMAGSNIPPATYKISFRSQPNSLIIHNTEINSANFMTPWAPGGTQNGNGMLDAHCVKYENLPLGEYKYNEETITGAGADYYVVPRYNDGDTLAPVEFRNFFHYGPGIYGDDQIPGLSNNPNSDGKLTLTADRPDRVIAVLNQWNTYTPPAPQTGSITVCNVIAKADGTIVNSSAGLPEAAFSLNLRSRIGTTTPVQTSAPFQETNFYSNLFTQTNPSPIPVSAQCLKYNNLELKQYVYSQVTVTSQQYDRWETPKYNDQYITPVSTSTDFFAFSPELFDNNPGNDGQRNENSDGIVTLEAARPNRVLVIYNKLKPVVPATSGKIIACKIIQDDQSQLVHMGGTHLPSAQFSMTITSNTNSAVGRTAIWDSATYMTTWPSPGADPSSTASALDADCQTFDNLPFDPAGYTYAEEVIAGPGASYYVVPRYNDGSTLPPSRFSNFFHYGPGIYGDDQIPGLSNNPNSDGKIVLTAENPVARIFVLNQYNTYNPPVPVCANGTSLTGEEFIQNRDLGLIRWTLGPLGPTADADHVIIHASSTFAKFHITNDTGCTIPLGMGSYKVFSQHEWQEVYDIVEQVNATSSTDIYVNVPNCMAQIDVFFGRADRVLQPYGPNGENPYIYPGAQGNFIFSAGFYFPTHGTWGDLPNGYCSRNPVNHPPVLTVLGANPMTVNINTTFTDPGATATDQEDGDLTSQIVTTGTVDTNTLGSYTINYTVTDSDGLTASGSRVVNVVENPDGDDGDDDDNGGGSRRNGQRKSGGRGGEILGAEIEPTSCFYLRDYLRRDFNNDKSEVLKLQFFLKYFENESNLEATGTFDQATYDAVSRFQNKYLNDILSPWGHTAPTGYVYILTKKKVNEIFCNTPFPVNAAQQDEIDAFRALLQSQGINGPGMMDDGGEMIQPEDIDNMVGVGETDSISSNMGKMVKDKIDTKNLRAVAAAIFSVPNDRETVLQSIYFLLIAIIAIYLFTEIIVGSRDSSKLTKYQVWSRKATGYIVGLVIAIIAAIWYQVFSIVVPLIALAIASAVFLIWTMTKDSKNDVINLPSSKN